MSVDVRTQKMCVCSCVIQMQRSRDPDATIMAHGTNREYLLSVDLGYDFSTWGNQKDTRNTYRGADIS